MKKKIVRIALVCIVVSLCVICWCWWVSRTSNPWNVKYLCDISTPLGYTRVEVPEGSYEEYLRSLPLKKRGSKVQLYTGGDAHYQFLSSGVIDKEILSNSEQCADVTMHLRAEYLWKQGRYNEICFRNVNGKMMRYRGGSSKKAFENYMRDVFGWCSTFSVYHETEVRKIKDIQPGDVLVYPARSNTKLGHAILVVDVAKNSKGRIAVMCVEGNTPAREMHLLRNPNPLKNPWFFLDEDDKAIWISFFHFSKDQLRHY